MSLSPSPSSPAARVSASARRSLRESLLLALLAGCGSAAAYATAHPWRLGGFALAAALWLTLLVYAWRLCRWNGASCSRLAPPFAIIIAVGITANSPAPIIAAWLLTLSWVRSGLTQEVSGPRQQYDRILPRLFAELLLCLIPGALIAAQLLSWPLPTSGAGFALVPPRALQLGLGVWLFFLLQSLYVLFFEPKPARPLGDPFEAFERAKRRAETILGEKA